MELGLLAGRIEWGSAAVVAAGYTPIAHGTNGGGSNRIPFSACGVFGMKASRGRQASGELDGTHPVFKTHHAISRTVRDSATLFAATEIQHGGKYPAVSAAGHNQRDLLLLQH